MLESEYEVLKQQEQIRRRNKRCYAILIGIGVVLGCYIFALMMTDSCSAEMNKAVMKELDAEKYAGVWYELMEKSVTKPQQCVTATYTVKDANTIKVVNSALNGKKGDMTGSGITGEATRKDNSGNLYVKLGGWFLRMVASGPYKVIDTDYDNYAFVYGCSYAFLGVGRVELVYILGRAPLVSSSGAF